MDKLNSKSIKISPFIRKLFKILKYSKHQEVVSWTDDGQSFIIKDQFNFTEKILPQYFNHSNFASFNRLLNMYAFHKIKKDSLEFSNPLFQRNNKILLCQIKRKTGEPDITKQEKQKIEQKLESFQLKQVSTENMLLSLERHYDRITELNQILVSELKDNLFTEKAIKKYKEKIGKNEKFGENSSSGKPKDEKIFSDDD